MIKTLQPTIGTDWMQANRAANRCRCLFATTYEGRTGRRCCRTYTDDPRNSASLLGTLQWKAMEQKQRENSERTEREAFESSSAALRPLYPRSLLLPRPLPFIATKGAVRHSILHQPYLTASILVGTYFVLMCFLARACVKSRFPRFGAPIPPLDGFLHDTGISDCHLVDRLKILDESQRSILLRHHEPPIGIRSIRRFQNPHTHLLL